MYVHIYKALQLEFKLQHPGTYGQPQDRPAVFVIAQQYSSTTFVSLPFHSLKENSACLRKVIVFLLHF
jgi:hypothetical protein